MGDPAARRHQFLVSLERSHEGGSFALDTGVVSVRDVQRERGEIAVEGVGTLELSAAERDGMHRIDVRELDRTLQSLGRLPTLAAFRYQTAAAGTPGLALDVKRFADAGVLAAVADRVTATTLVTAEGRALTEVRLQIQNRAQPFLKVALPAGATMASVEVAGEPAKPALGADGTRVPLLRPGLRPNGSYEVSFVYLHAGTPFAKKGDLDMMLPKMDIPVGLVDLGGVLAGPLLDPRDRRQRARRRGACATGFTRRRRLRRPPASARRRRRRCWRPDRTGGHVDPHRRAAERGPGRRCAMRAAPCCRASRSRPRAPA